MGLLVARGAGLVGVVSYLGATVLAQWTRRLRLAEAPPVGYVTVIDLFRDEEHYTPRGRSLRRVGRGMFIGAMGLIVIAIATMFIGGYW